MAAIRTIAGLALACLVSGCASWFDRGSANSAMPDETVMNGFGVAATDMPLGVDMPDFKVEAVNVEVPETLVVSEANSYFPKGDIVWRGDPPGDRHEQVAAIFQDGLTRGAAKLQGEVPVNLDVEVLRFHALTEKTRYSVGGIHSIRFELGIRSAETGLLLEPTRTVQADLKGYGGSRAIAADQQGQTQKVRITDHLSEVIVTELTDPEGYKNQRLGLIQIFDNQF